MIIRIVSRTSILLAVLFATTSLSADVRLPAIISDHMVLQAELPAPIWGWADPNESVTVTIADQSQTTKADAAGKWQVKLTNLAVNAKPQTLTVKGNNTLTVKDVLIGEVWLGSGQSNMAMVVKSCLDFDKEQAAPNLPQVRMFTVVRNPQPEAQNDCQGSWIVSSPESVGSFSAALYFCGRDLHAVLKQPVGLINSSYGGTTVEAWTSVAAQSKLPIYPEVMSRWNEALAQPWDQAAADEKFKKQMDACGDKAKAAKAEGKAAPRAPRAPKDPRIDQNRPGNLFNGMIEPIIPYAFRGAVWYQGEGNSARTYKGSYGLQLRTLIAEWRSRFGHDFPFAWVQLPDYRAPQKEPVEASSWAVIREQMLKTLDVPKTGMAVALGLGEEKDIHPKNKQGVGDRLAMRALADVYGRSGLRAVRYEKHRVDGNSIIVSFEHVDGGLKAKGGELKGFAIAGADKKFVWANAKIDGERVIVSSPDVLEPKAVVHAWADNPIWSLMNGAANSRFTVPHG